MNAVPGHSADASSSQLGEPSRKRPAEVLSGGVYATLIKLVWPLVCSNLLNVSVSIVDMYFAGRLRIDGRPDIDALAAIGAASQFFDTMIVFMLAFGGGTAIIVARHFGAGRPERVGAVVRDALIFAAVVAFAIMLPAGYLLGDTVLATLGLTGRPHALGLEYLYWRLPSGLFIAMGFVVGSAWIGAGDTRTPLAILLVMSLLNVALTPVLMFGWLGAPELGVAGAAIGSLASRTVGWAITIYLLLRGRTRVRLGRQPGPYSWSTVRQVIALGLPRSLEGIVRTVTALVIISFVGAAALKVPELTAARGLESARAIAIGAYTVVMSVQRIPTFIGLALMTATMALVGQSLGAGSPQRATAFTRAAAWLSMGMLSASALVMLLAPGPLMRLFNGDPQFVAVGRPLFMTLAFGQPLMAFSLVLTGCLRGAGDTMWPFFASLLSQFGVALGVSYVVIEFFDGSLQALWLVIVLSVVVRAVLILSRFLAGKWKNIEI